MYTLALLITAALVQDKPVPESDALKYGEKIATAIAAGDGSILGKCFDVDALVEAATRGIEVSKKMREGFAVRAKEGTGLGTALVSTLKQGGSFEVLRVRQKDGVTTVLFRLVTVDGLNYDEFFLGRAKDGSIVVRDLLPYKTGERQTKILRRLFLAAARASSDTLKVPEADQEWMKNIDKIQSMQLALKQGKHKEVLDAFEKLPESLKKDLHVLVLRLRAAQELGDKELNAAIDAFDENVPKKDQPHLLVATSAIIRKQFDRALSSLDALDEQVGGDPYLNVVRSRAHLQAGHADKAKSCAEAALKADPKLVDAVWALIEVSLHEKTFDETARLLTRIEKDFSLTINDLTKIPEYAEFVKSDAYREWMKDRQ